MKCFSILVFFFSMMFLMACSSGEKVHNASELQPGMQLDTLTIKEVRNSDEGFLLALKDTLVLEGIVVNSSIGDYGLKRQLLTDKIKIGENIIDLGLNDVVFFRNYKELPQYFDASMYEESPDGKVLKDGHLLKVKVANVQINTSARDLVSGEAVEILALNGEPVTPQPSEEKKEVESDEMLNFEDLEVGQEVDGVPIVKHELVPNDYFILEFSGEFTTSGELYFDDMWYELTFAANEGEPLKRTMEVTGLPIEMMSYVKFTNKQEVRAALGEEKVKNIESGQRLAVTMVVRDFRVAGAFQSEYGNMIEFVSFVE